MKVVYLDRDRLAEHRNRIPLSIRENRQELETAEAVHVRQTCHCVEEGRRSPGGVSQRQHQRPTV